MGWDYASVEMGSLTGPLSIPQMIHEWIWSSGGMILTGENRRTWRKTCPSDTFPTANHTRLTWARTWAAALGSRRLTAWAMALPSSGHMSLILEQSTRTPPPMLTLSSLTLQPPQTSATYGRVWSGSRQCLIVDFCGNGNELSSYIKGENILVSWAVINLVG
jgi:hypothetical protein